MDDKCATCARPFSSYFEVTRYDSKGQPGIVFKLCSLPCLMRWAYKHSVDRGRAAVEQVQNVVEQLFSALAGPRGPQGPRK